MFISNLPLTARVALCAANEALKLHESSISQPELMLEHLRRVRRPGPAPTEESEFLVRYRLFGPEGRRNSGAPYRDGDYVVRVFMRRDWGKMGKTRRLQFREFWATIARKGMMPAIYSFELRWTETANGPQVVRKKPQERIVPPSTSW